MVTINYNACKSHRRRLKWMCLAHVVTVFFFCFQQLQLKEGSLNYNNWIETPLPMYIKFTMFNWTNAQEIQAANYKPNLTEVGPYVFLEKHKRVNVTFHSENDTVSFDQIRTWHFMPNMSVGTLDDNITNVNVIAAVSCGLIYQPPSMRFPSNRNCFVNISFRRQHFHFEMRTKLKSSA